MPTSTTFQVSGTITYTPSTWTDQLVYEDDNGVQVPIASPTVNLSPASFTLSHAPMSAGSHTITIKDPLTGATQTSNTFTVGGTQAVAVAAPTANPVAGQSFTLSGTLTNFSTPPTLTYTLTPSGGTAGTPVNIPNPTATSYSVSITVATAGNYSVLVVANGAISSPAVSFTVSPVAVTHAINPAPPMPTSNINYVFYDRFTSLADVTDTGGPVLNVTATITASPTGQSFVDSNGGIWTIVGGEALLNNAAPAYSANVVQLQLINGVVWQENSGGSYYYYDTATNPVSWQPGPNPTIGGVAGSWMNHYAFGGSEYTLSANDELEYFTSSTRTPGFSPFTLQNGGAGPGLIITCDTATTTGANAQTGHTPQNSLNLPYNSGCICSATEYSGEPQPGLFSFTYGLIEIQALLPGNAGSWAGFNLYRLGTPSAPGGSGELDIIENGGGNQTTVYGSIHSSTGGQSVGVTVTDYTVNRHIYACNWTAETITWLVDGVQYASIATPTDFIGNAFYITLEYSIQGNPDLGFDGVPTASTPFPNTMSIDWVRVSQGTTNSIPANSTLNFTGSLSGYTTIPSLTYTITPGGSPIAIPGVTLTGWSVQFTAPAAQGAYQITVTDGTTTGMTSFSVGPAAQTITPLAPSSPVAGQSFTFTGVLAGFTTIPALTYSVDSGAAVALTGVSTTGWSATVSIATSGSHTITVSTASVPTVTGSVTFTVAAQNTALRTWYQSPGMDGSFWVQPFYTTANWITSGANVTLLRNGVTSSGAVAANPTGYVTLAGNYAVPWYMGQATDPKVTVTDGKNSIVVHIPLGAQIEGPTSPYDQSIGGADATQPYLVWSISGATMTVNGATASAVAASGTVITGTYGMCVQDGSGLIMVDAVTGEPGDNNSIGQLQDYELSLANANPNYVIQHMLTFQMDPRQAAPGTGTLPWPLNAGDGGATYTGTIPQGITIGIPANVPRPTGMSRGWYLLFDNLQQYGWFNYNFGSTGCTFIACYSTLPANAALVTDLQNSISSVMGYVCILNYASGVTGSQYSLATTKGLAPGGVSAFTPPPLLDLSPTGGVNVSPSTFGAWYPSGYNATPTNTQTSVTYMISPATPTGVVVNTAFTFTGTLSGYSSAPTLTYAVNNGTATALGGVTTTGWSTSITIATSGTTTIVVNDATHGVSGSCNFSVSTGTTPPPPNAVTFNASDKSSTITLSNNNYTAASGGSTTAGSARQSVRATTAINTAVPVLFEFTFTAITQNSAVGLANSTYALSTTGGGLGGDANGLGFYPSTGTGSQPAQTAYLNNAQLTSGNGTASVAGAVITVLVYNNLAFFSDAAMRSTSGVSWNNSTTANPLTGAGGFSLTGLGSTYYPIFASDEGGATVTLNDGTSAFSSFAQAYASANASVKALSAQGTVTVTKTIVPATPANIVAGAPFTFTGTLNNYTSVPTLVYTLSGASAVALGGVTQTGWSTTLTIATAGNYTITVSDGTISGATSSFVVSQASNTTPTAPSQAAAVGYTALLFNSDFTSSNEVAPNGSATSGYNWYWQVSEGTSASNITINTGLTASGVSNGNNGGGSFASSAGGILTLNGPYYPYESNVTICSTPQSTQGQGGNNTNPGFGNWAYCYIEIYAQLQPTFQQESQWYALWACSQQLFNSTYQEVDFMETFCGNFGYASTFMSFGSHEWNTSGGGSEPESGGGQYGAYVNGVYTSTPIDSNWHLYGFLWVKTGTNTGYVSCYFDNVLQTPYNNPGGAPYSSAQIPTGTNGAYGWNYLDPCGPIYLKLGGPSGSGGDLNIDYVRVWGNNNTITS